MTTIPQKLPRKTRHLRTAADTCRTTAGYGGAHLTFDSSPQQEHGPIDNLSGKDRAYKDDFSTLSSVAGASWNQVSGRPRGTWVPTFGWVVIDEVEQLGIDVSLDTTSPFDTELFVVKSDPHTNISRLEPFEPLAIRRAMARPSNPGTPRSPALSPNLSRRRRRKRRKRSSLPLLLTGLSGTPTKVMACPDSGSVANVISLELVDILGLEIGRVDSNELREFDLPNGKSMTALGQVSTTCSFDRGSLSGPSKLKCTFHVVQTLSVQLIMGIEFLQETQTLSKHKDRLVEQLIPTMQPLRVSGVGRPKRGLICQLGKFVGCATVDTGSDLDLINLAFAKSRGYKIEPGVEKVEFADCSVGYTVGVIKTSFVVGSMSGSKFRPRGKAIDLDLFVLENLTADILIGQNTTEELDIFGLHNDLLIPNSLRLGQSDINIIRHIGSIEQGATKLWKKAKDKFSNSTPSAYKNMDIVTSQNHLDQKENARREQARATIAKLSGYHKRLEQTIEDERIRAFEEQKVVSLHVAQSGTDFHVNSSGPSSNTQAATAGPGNNGGMAGKQTRGYKCTKGGCTAAPFPTRSLLTAHSNVHTTSKPYHCPIKGCARGEGGKGFKKENELIRHGLEHPSPGYVCPFCKDIQHKYPRPENLQRHFRVHHSDKSNDDPLLCDALAQRHHGSTSVGRTPAPQS